LAIRTDVIGVVLGVEVAEDRALELLYARRDRAIARDLEVGSIDLDGTWANLTLPDPASQYISIYFRRSAMCRGFLNYTYAYGWSSVVAVHET
jgi:hypothetical protein